MAHSFVHKNQKFSVLGFTWGQKKSRNSLVVWPNFMHLVSKVAQVCIKQNSGSGMAYNTVVSIQPLNLMRLAPWRPQRFYRVKIRMALFQYFLEYLRHFWQCQWIYQASKHINRHQNQLNRPSNKKMRTFSILKKWWLSTFRPRPLKIVFWPALSQFSPDFLKIGGISIRTTSCFK